MVTAATTGRPADPAPTVKALGVEEARELRRDFAEVVPVGRRLARGVLARALAHREKDALVRVAARPALLREDDRRALPGVRHERLLRQAHHGEDARALDEPPAERRPRGRGDLP